MKAWHLVSTCRVLCTRDFVFIFKCSYNNHILMGTSLIVTEHQVLAVSVRWWVRCEPSPSAFSGRVSCPHVCPVYSSYEGCSQGWMGQSTHALASLPGSWISSQHHTSPRMLFWRCFHVRAVHVPLETSMAADSRDCEDAAGFLYTFAPAVLLTWSPGTDQT